jgi:hypothetical protein
MSQVTLTSDPLGSATTGTLEFENPAFFMTGATSQRGAVLVDQYILQQATYTLTSQTAAQELFGVTANGAVTLVPGTYEFECQFSLSSMSGSSGSFGFALGGAATKTEYWIASARKSALTDTATTNALVVSYNTAANTGLVVANTVTTGFARVHGVVIVTVGGTLIPQVSLGVAAAAVVGIGSFFKIRALGSATAASSGNWS